MALTASPENQLQLIELAQIDTKLIQLDHQRVAIPELKAIQDLEIELGSIDLKTVAAQTEVSDLTQAQSKAEADVEQVELRISKDQERLSAGTGNPKDLESLQHELGTLAKRLSELEDVELGILQQLEDAQSALADLTNEKNLVTLKLADTRKVFESKLHEVEQLILTEQESRKKLTQSLPTELVDLYEKIRADRGDVGAALLSRGSCQGCHLSLDATEINRIKDLPEDAIVRCEECRRILVRAKG